MHARNSVSISDTDIVCNPRHKELREKICDETIIALHSEPGSGHDLGDPYDANGNPAPAELIKLKEDQLVIVSVCGAGRHRSVANGNTLKLCLENTHWPNTAEAHLLSPFWDERGCQSRTSTPPCRDCDPERSRYARESYQREFLAIFQARLVNFDNLLWRSAATMESNDSGTNDTLGSFILENGSETNGTLGSFTEVDVEKEEVEEPCSFVAGDFIKSMEGLSISEKQRQVDSLDKENRQRILV